MKLKKLLILPIVLVLSSVLTACVTTAKFEARMDAKKGLNKAQLIEEMGIPDREYKIDNFEILEYNQSQTVSSSESDTTVVNGYLINTRTSVPHTVWCRLEFKLINNVVESYRYKGDMCRSR